jgi:hypothetical protein
MSWNPNEAENGAHLPNSNQGQQSDEKTPQASPPEQPQSKPPQQDQPSYEQYLQQPLANPYAQPQNFDPYALPSSGYAASANQQPPPGYGSPPNQPPPGYGLPPNQLPPPGYGYYAPSGPPPLPLSAAIQDLPRQYWKILRRPGARSFAEEQTRADWGIIWVQILLLVFVGLLINVPTTLINSSRTLSTNNLTIQNPVAFSAISATFDAIFLSLIIPLIFFATIGIQYLIAKAFKGTGEFKQQAYNQLLFSAPLEIVLLLIDFLLVLVLTLALRLPVLVTSLIVTLLGFAFGTYEIVLNVFSIMAVHRLPGGKASAVVLIPYGALILLILLCACSLFLVGIIAGMNALHL